ncbi:hypothetical protein CAPTEDRAFT_166856 [Capitella teleta]|uniref:DNA excision repair protein ERCC-1 n=1 Tax=Capitella teleta TaxID=283909 RepID=R7VCC8_CAPTE|nr:hypothetical protein CAPTEDRAFT_166856 [Capitella teleta]|eukprot:ELU13340.1 hypothetical protein CAPTEDRAFT_166856 [Capitella teleta]
MASTNVPGPGSSSSKTESPSRPARKNCIIVSSRQRGNPILKHIRNVAWEFGETVADYELGLTTCALFLSLRYHLLTPNYIHERLKQLGHCYNLRVLLVLIDVKDPHHCLQELASVCILSDCTLMVAFSPEEAGRYLETYKSFETKPPDLIMEKTEANFLSKFTDCLTSVRKINKTDAATLLSTFKTFDAISEANVEDLSLLPGFGPQKVRAFSFLYKRTCFYLGWPTIFCWVDLFLHVLLTMCVLFSSFQAQNNRPDENNV